MQQASFSCSFMVISSSALVMGSSSTSCHGSRSCLSSVISLLPLLFILSLLLNDVRQCFGEYCVHASPTTTVVRKERIGESCTPDDIAVYQSATGPLPNGIPTYTVDILNECVSMDCTLSDIHVKCGWFASYHLIDPRIFRRVAYDDCLVNDGDPLPPGGGLSFVYSNTFCYPLDVSSAACN